MYKNDEGVLLHQQMWSMRFVFALTDKYDFPREFTHKKSYLSPFSSTL